jgi:hypothetical protein
MFDLKINSLTSELIIVMDANEKELMSIHMVVFHIEIIGQSNYWNLYVWL